ncbi:hypothetical protein 7865G3D7_4 [Haloquadratum phage sp.]|nr:hypothetical protein 7865G3D7_4 [Haloquadratum phage sp.]
MICVVTVQGHFGLMDYGEVDLMNNNRDEKRRYQRKRMLMTCKKCGSDVRADMIDLHVCKK